MEIKDLICEKRKEKKLTQRQLGELLGYEGRTAEMMVQKWEYGSRPVNPKHYRKLAEIFGISPEELIP